MTFLTQFAQSTLAARTVAIVLLAALSGIVTDAVLKVNYGAPAPAIMPVMSPQPSKAAPNWLLGASAAAAAPTDLKLLGVIAQGVGGLALLQQTGKRPQVLRVGQSMADGTRLKSVQGKTATVWLNNETRTLTLDAIGNASAALAINSASAPPTYNMPSVGFAPVPDLSAQTAQQMQQVQQLQQLQQASVSEGQVAAAAVEASPGSSLKRRMGGRP
jgi:hypothetical protein